jgi:hypothetical protein
MNKKLLYLTVVALIVFSSASIAQVQFAVGLKAGPNFAKLDVNSDVNANYKNRTGWHGGAFVLIKATKFGVQPELLFSKQGSKFTVNSTDYESNFDYISIPVMLKLYTVAGINLQIGPQISFLSSAGGTAIQNTSGTASAISASKDLYKSSDLSAAFGVGWDLPFGLMIDARYNLGLSKIQDNPNLESTKNQVIRVSVGYKLIKIGK